MTTSVSGGSATIYQFPLRGRFAVKQRLEQQASATALRATQTACGSAWYHDEAMQEDEKKNN